MANNWSIPDWLEKEVREKDKVSSIAAQNSHQQKLQRKSQRVGNISSTMPRSLQEKTFLSVAVVATQAKVKSNFRCGFNPNTAKSAESRRNQWPQ